MDLYRFYVATFNEPTVGLPEDQSHHALHVLRLDPGTPVIVFDGKGTWAQGILRPEKRGTFVDLTSTLQRDPPPSPHVTLATAIPKSDRAEWLIEQASQLGVSIVQWIDTDRGVVKPKESGGKMDKFRRLAMESAKQCGRTHLLTIAPIRPLQEILRVSPGDTLLWLDPRAPASLRDVLPPAAGRIIALVGPEGGWSEREQAQISGTSGARAVKLTPTILRIETACAAVAAILMAR